MAKLTELFGIGDGTRVPNSVIEHIVDPDARRLFAAAVRRLPADGAGDREAKKRYRNSALGHRMADAIGSGCSIPERDSGAGLLPI